MLIDDARLATEVRPLRKHDFVEELSARRIDDRGADLALDLTRSPGGDTLDMSFDGTTRELAVEVPVLLDGVSVRGGRAAPRPQAPAAALGVLAGSKPE